MKINSLKNTKDIIENLKIEGKIIEADEQQISQNFYYIDQFDDSSFIYSDQEDYSKRQLFEYELKSTFHSQHFNDVKYFNLFSDLIQISNPNVIKFAFLIMLPQQYQFVQHYDSQNSLSQQMIDIKKIPIPIIETKCIVVKLCQILNQLSRQGILQRYLNIDNILITKTYQNGCLQINTYLRKIHQAVKISERTLPIPNTDYSTAPEVETGLYGTPALVQSIGQILFFLVENKTSFISYYELMNQTQKESQLAQLLVDATHEDPKDRISLNTFVKNEQFKHPNNLQNINNVIEHENFTCFKICPKEEAEFELTRDFFQVESETESEMQRDDKKRFYYFDETKMTHSYQEKSHELGKMSLKNKFSFFDQSYASTMRSGVKFRINKEFKDGFKINQKKNMQSFCME